MIFRLWLLFVMARFMVPIYSVFRQHLCVAIHFTFCRPAMQPAQPHMTAATLTYVTDSTCQVPRPATLIVLFIYGSLPSCVYMS